MNKKGALELSITAIVVLIIAITLLGLAIFFIRNLFSEGTELFTGELAKIKDQLRKTLEESGETVVISKGTELKVKRGEPLEFHIGVRNTEDERCYRLAFRCISPFTTGNTCVEGQADPLLVGGMDQDGSAPTVRWFPRVLSQFVVPGNDISVAPATMQIANARPDTYSMELNVFKGDSSDCGTVQAWSKETKRFFIILS